MKDRIIKYLEGVRDYSQSYHNHKETAAWSGLALYAVFCGIIAKTNFSSSDDSNIKLGFTVLIVFVALLVFMYMRNQFKLKDIATSYFAASMYLLLEVIAKDEDEIKPSDYLTLLKQDESKEYSSSYFLPGKLLKTARDMMSKGAGAGRRTRSLAYTILITITAGTIAFQWIEDLRKGTTG